MAKIPTTIIQKGNKILIRCYDDETGTRHNLLSTFKPCIYERAPFDTTMEMADALPLRGEGHPLKGRFPLRKVEFDNIWDFKNHVWDNRGVPGYEMWGMPEVEGQAYSKLFPNKFKHKLEYIKNFNIDIEVMSSYIGADGKVVRGPFPEPIIEPEEFRKSSFNIDEYAKHIQKFNEWWSKEFPKSRIPMAMDIGDVGALDAAFPVVMIQAENMQTGQNRIWSLPRPKDRGSWTYDNEDEMIGGLEGKIKFEEFETEQELLTSFVNWWAAESPDGYTGWNIRGFDTGYIVARIYKVLGSDWVSALSPIGEVKKYLVRPDKGIPFHSFNIKGVDELDLQLLYKKHRLVERKSYSLDYIAKVETGEQKIKYSGDLNTVWLEDYETYCRYGIKDILLVNGINKKLRFVELAWALQARYKANAESASLDTVKPWRYLLHDFNFNKGDVPLVPLIKGKSEATHYEGAFVHPPQVGLHKLLSAFDLNSLYPHIEQQYNMGPETIVEDSLRTNIIFELCEELEAIPAEWDQENAKKALISAIRDDREIIDELVAWALCGLPREFKTLKDLNVSMAPNLQFFHNDEESCYSSITKDIYATRKAFKKEMLYHEQAALNAKDSGDMELYEVESNKESESNTFQMGEKILANSGYGAIGNDSFLEYFDSRIARAITASGMLINKYVTEFINRFIASLSPDAPKKAVVYGDTDSVVGSTLVSVNGVSRPIEEVYNELKGTIETRGVDNFIKHVTESVKTPSVNTENKVEEKQINYVMKHKVKKQGYRLTVGGESVVVTCDHSLIVMRNGSLKSVKPSEVMKGDKFVKISNETELEIYDDFQLECIGEIDDWVYDIEVDDNHNFFGNDILVHNSVYVSFDGLQSYMGLEESMERDEKIEVFDKFMKAEIVPKIAEYSTDMCGLVNGREQRMFWEREVLCLEGGIFQAKKMYALIVDDNEGVRYPKPKLKVTGLHSKKSTTPDLVVPWLENAYTLAIKGEFDELKNYIKERKQVYKDLPIEDIAISSSVNQIGKWVINFDNYVLKSGVPYHVRASVIHNLLIKRNNIPKPFIEEGSKIKIINIKEQNEFDPSGKTKYLAFPDTGWPEEFDEYRKYIDYSKLFEKVFEQPCQLFLDAVGETTKQVNALW